MTQTPDETPADALDEVPFEEALTELQSIVHELDGGAQGLEESMRQFEQGIRLLRRCHTILERAEQRIETLTGTDAEGNPVTAAFDATATTEQGERQAGRRKSGGRRASSVDAGGEEGASEGKSTLF